MTEFKPYQNLELNKVLEADRKWDAFFSLPNENNSSGGTPDCYPQIDLAALQTSYNDYFKILNELGPDKTICDLGAGFGRGSFLSWLMGWSNCYSLELSEQRFNDSLRAAKTIGMKEDLFILGDIKEAVWEKYDSFYFYFPLNQALLFCLSEICIQSKHKDLSLFCVEAHGETLPVIDHLNCFELENEWPLSTPRHHHFLKKYKVRPFGDSKEEHFLKLMKDEGYCIYKYFHLILKEEVEWILDTKSCLLMYEDEWKVQYLPLGRKIKLSELTLAAQSFKPPLQFKVGRGKILRLSQQYYWENNVGLVERLY